MVFIDCNGFSISNISVMKEFNEQEFNKLCAELVCDYDAETKRFIFKQEMFNNISYGMSKRHHEEQLCFHSDWNWIMEVVEKIENIERKQPYSHPKYRISSYRYLPEEWQADIQCLITTECIIQTGNFKSKKQAVVQAIWQFLNWYKQQKHDTD